MDKLKYPKYTEEMFWYPEKPFELKHVYDTEENRYVTNEQQCCYYSPKSKHRFCTHKDNCIFNNDKWEYYDERLHPIVSQIKNIRQTILDYENIKQGLLNDEIIYHDTLKEYYTISKIRDAQGNIEVKVSTPSNFKNIINIAINNLKLELRQLNRELLRTKRKR